MRFLLEFRPLFNAAGNAKHFNASLSAPRQIGHPLLHVLDQSEVFSNLNRQPILFTVESVREDNDEFNIEPSKVEITVGRDLHWASTIWANEKRVQPENIIERDGKVVNRPGFTGGSNS